MLNGCYSKKVQISKKDKEECWKGIAKTVFDNKYEYELVKVYKHCALYKNLFVNEIKESMTIFDIKNNSNIEVLTDKEQFESPYFEEIWEKIDKNWHEC